MQSARSAAQGRPEVLSGPSTSASKEKCACAAVIRKDGQVDSIALLRHLDDRLDRSAAEALAKWQFEPAIRDGTPVEVDAVFEIPFRLAPRSDDR